MPILRPITQQQKHASIGNLVRQQIERRLRLGVYPVRVLKNDYYWLIQALGHDDALECFQRPLAL